MKCTIILCSILAFLAPMTSATYFVVPEASTPAGASPGPNPAVLRPELVPVCACESSYEGGAHGTPQQFEPDGVTVRYGRVDPDDRGICMINRRYHGREAAALGLDIETEAGNIAFANRLFEELGFKPWVLSYDPKRGKCVWEL